MVVYLRRTAAVLQNAELMKSGRRLAIIGWFCLGYFAVVIVATIIIVAARIRFRNDDETLLLAGGLGGLILLVFLVQYIITLLQTRRAILLGCAAYKASAV